MRLMVSLCVLLAAGSNVLAQTPEVDQAEVLRLGNMVQVVGDGARASAETDSYVEALGPPASDADKWFISVVSMRGCAGCERLKKDWGTSPWLLALANPADAKQSWAHYTVYDKDDRSQQWRLANIQVTTYPTILVQPPRSGKYGDGSTVVYQGVYGGDPEKLAREITQAIRQYVSKLQSRPVAVEGETGQVGVDPPWQPVPKVDPWQPSPQPVFPSPANDPTIPPPPAPAAPTVVPAFPWSSVLTLIFAGFSLPAAVALLIWGVYYIRAHREAEGKPPLIDPAITDRFLDLLKKFAESQAAPLSTPRQ